MSATRAVRTVLGVSLFTLLCSSSLYGDLATANCTSVTLTISSASPADSATVTCPSFDPSLGTLQSVFIGLPGTYTNASGSSATIQNNGATDLSPGGGELIFGDLSFTYGAFPGGITLTAKSPMTTKSTIGAGSTQTVPIVGLQLLLSGVIHAITSPLDGFEGPGDLSILISVNSGRYSNLDASAALLDYSDTLNIGSFRLVYGYAPIGESYTYSVPAQTFLLARTDSPTPVPEPTTAALAAGVLALGFLARVRALSVRKPLPSNRD